MSGGHHQHPHGRQGQPNPAWNPLQLPNYFPVRPQIAHMSSDRPLAHSPLTWHTPTPPEHQKNAPNPYRHTPTPPDVQALKAASTLPYRHTPTPPDLKSFRHTPTPPDVAHSMKTSGVLHYRHTPTPPDVHKGAASPIFNLQQMISDTRAPSRDSMRDNLGFSRHSPGLTHGSMDLSVTRSPRNGSQNGETTAPISLSVRDATKINSLDSAEISKLHQPLLFTGKSLDMKPSSPTVNSMSQRSNSPKSPLASSKKPVKNVASILERLNSVGVGDGVVITPVQHTPSPQSVIVSAHSLEDSNSRGSSSSSVNITHMTGITPYYTCEAANMERVTPPALHPHNTTLPLVQDESAAVSIIHHPPSSEVSSKIVSEVEQTQTQPVAQSVIKESVLIRKDDSPSLANENSNDSSTSDSGRLKKKRKPTRKSTEGDPTTENTHPATEENVRDEAVQSVTESTPANTMVNKLIEQLPVKNDTPSQTLVVNINDATANGITPVEDKMEKNDPVSVVSKTRRKNSSESETIDNIAAMIASTENASNICFPKKPISEISAERDPNLSIMHTEQLKEVLGSPTERPSDSASSPNQKEAAAVPEPAPLGKQRKKRLSRSQSVEISQNETSKSSADVTDQNTVQKAKPDFVEVENELEKMFAGIEQNEPPTLTSQVADATAALPPDSAHLESNNNDKKKASQRNNRAARRASIGASQMTVSSDESTPKKKKNSKKNKCLKESTSSSSNKKKRSLGTPNSNTPNKKLKRDKSADKSKLEILSHKDAYDSGSNASSNKSRGPYVQIKGPRDSPLSVSVINTPIIEEDGDKPLQKVKTLKSKSSLNSDSDFKNKVKSKGLHSSTLSMKYDATNIDTSWICVFCKRGPHTGGSSGNAKQMGDLFGPYIVTTQCADFNSMINDPQDTVFKNKVKPGTFSQNKQAKPHGRKNKVEAEVAESKPREDIYFGMTEAGSNTYEVWFHEDCAVWAPGLYLVGAKIVGLDSAVWGSCTVKCDVCKMTGACIACIKRGCLKSMHVNCARTDTWTLNENTFRVYCTEHAPAP